MITVAVINGREVAAEFALQSQMAPERVRRAVDLWGDILLYTIKGMADGAPGPEIRTGRYHASIRKETSFSTGNFEVGVGTDEPYGYRLELGFSGVDAAGRQTSSAPYPHYGPAMNALEGTFEAEILRAAMGGW